MNKKIVALFLFVFCVIAVVAIGVFGKCPPCQHHPRRRYISLTLHDPNMILSASSTMTGRRSSTSKRKQNSPALLAD